VRGGGRSKESYRICIRGQFGGGHPLTAHAH